MKKKEKKEKISLGVKSHVFLNNAIANAVRIKAKPVIVETLFYSWLVYCNAVGIDNVCNDSRKVSIEDYILAYKDILEEFKYNPTSSVLYDEFKSFVEMEI